MTWVVSVMAVIVGLHVSMFEQVLIGNSVIFSFISLQMTRKCSVIQCVLLVANQYIPIIHYDIFLLPLITRIIY